MAEFQVRVEEPGWRLTGKMNAETEPGKTHQNKKEDPAKEPTDNVRERNATEGMN